MPHNPNDTGKHSIEFMLKKRYPAITFYFGFSQMIAVIAASFWGIMALGSFIAGIAGKSFLLGLLGTLICVGIGLFSFFISQVIAEYLLAVARIEINTNDELSSGKTTREKTVA